MAIMTKDNLLFSIDWFESAIARDSEHDQNLCLDCQANKLALDALKYLKVQQEKQHRFLGYHSHK
jgi:hypothetical protein